MSLINNYAGTIIAKTGDIPLLAVIMLISELCKPDIFMKAKAEKIGIEETCSSLNLI
jgi:hypothetical protein